MSSGGISLVGEQSAELDALDRIYKAAFMGHKGEETGEYWTHLRSECPLCADYAFVRAALEKAT